MLYLFVAAEHLKFEYYVYDTVAAMSEWLLCLLLLTDIINIFAIIT